MFLKGVVVDVGEINVIELHAAKLFQLFFYAAAHLQRDLQNLLDLFLAELAVWIQKLDQTADCFSDRNGISLIQVTTQAEETVQAVALLLLPQLPDHSPA